MEFVKYENGNGMRLGPLHTAFASSAKPGKSMMNIIIEESSFVNARPTTSSFEYEVLHEIVEYIMNTPSTQGMDMRDAIKQFWNERLN